MSYNDSIIQTTERQIIDFLRKTPIAVAALFFSFISGHLWVFIIFSYCKKNKKGNSQLQSKVGRTAIGLAWFMFVMVPIYLLQYNNLKFNYTNLVDIVLPTLVLGFFFQVIVFALFAKFGN